MSTFETPQLQAPSLGTPTRRRNDGKLYVELKTATPPAKTLDNMRVNLARGLKPLGPCKPHGEVVSMPPAARRWPIPSVKCRAMSPPATAASAT